MGVGDSIASMETCGVVVLAVAFALYEIVCILIIFLVLFFARERADAALDRVHDLCSKSNTTEGSSYVPLVDEYELVSEFDDLRGVVLRESSDESDDSADSEHSSDDEHS